MDNLWKIIAIAVFLILLVVVVFAVQGRRRARAKAIHARSEVDEALALKDAALHDQHQAWTKFLEDQENVWAQERAAEVAGHQAAVERVRAWVSSSMRWEAASRDYVLDVCERAGLDGFIATNICFRTPSGPGTFVHQIDHLVVTRTDVLVIEAKNWSGLIYHFEKGKATAEQLPVERLPVLQRVPDADTYVLHVREQHPPTVLIGKEGREPVHQVIQQVMALKKTLEAQLPTGLRNLYIKACVFYSHGSSILVGGAHSIRQTFVTDRKQFSQLFASPSSRRGDVPIVELAQWAKLHGADIHGFGASRTTWVSEFPRS